ncbi:CBS domain-containing protein [Temperatibacter marinus]|uniref:CBS domain-containing protein n=1 Tax=Temperatibacter marinus TaxID=1456591 RepID=A0AA52H832_9PROT|nr:CBS domain-containing protein [Temperatibacter marinus]WND01701.1 CBS domain-containing protein [Temperatibacter marinus]
MTVKQILREKGNQIISIAEDDSVLDVSKLLGERRVGAVLVMKGDTLAGIISERDIIRGLSIRGGDVLGDKVESLMTRSVVTCTGTDSIHDLMEMMTERRIRHVPVEEEGKIIGVISIGDVVKERISETEHEAEALKQYITSA